MKLSNLTGFFATLFFLTTATAFAQSSATISIQANQPGVTISSNLFGIFFEEINSAGDGGIYAELIRNRSFEDSTNSPVFWSLVTSGTAAGQMNLDTSLPLSATNSQCLKLTQTGGAGTVGAFNNGYWGIPLTQAATYNLGFYARGASGFTGAITVSLESTNGGTVYAQTSIGGLTTGWQHFAVSLVPNITDASARLALRISQPGSVYLDFVSLFPAATFNNRTNGLRPDLANLLLNLQPSFMRFPGGSWVDGINLANAYHWQPTTGFLPDRTVRTNIWGYMVDNGLGYHEYLQMCEDLGTQPLFDVNAGIAGSEVVTPANLGPWVQEALDAIQYANGDTSTTFGAQRAANGHPAPFNLQYVEIGNENGGSAYNANYALFYDAIKSNYPALHIIANNWGGIPTSRPVEIMDEHYYNSASWFAQNATKFDTYSRTGPKVFVGEYAVAYTVGPGFLATLNNALGEAAFMTGMERNADIVSLACYAPLFCNVNNQDWTPNLIYFNGTQAYGTPSYYVQQMFSLNRGKVVLPSTVAGSSSLYVSASLVPDSGTVIIKAVNFSGSSQTTTINVNGVNAVAANSSVIQLTSANATDLNSFTAPTYVFPVTNTISNAGTNFTVTLPANSLSIFRLQASGFDSLIHLQLQFASTINAGQVVPATVSAQESGTGNLVNLNGNFAVSYSSANTNIATVDNNGLVGGVSSGATVITASYDGLTATQAVQVNATPPTTLIHRYSFNDGTAHDAIGTNDGIFYNASGNASIANGQLNLVGANGDYVDLGPGIISITNLTTGAITFEAWASFNAVNGAETRLFDFGNIVNNNGANYIFLTPNVSANGGNTRLAVSDSSPGFNDETGLNLNNLLGQTNVQVVAVFNPAPGRQFLGLYVNGNLVGSVATGNKIIASINDVFSLLGRSLYSGVGDAWLNGSIDEFRIYDGELNKFQIANDYQAGPNQLNYDLGTFTSFIVNAGTMPLPLNGSRQLSAFLNFSVATNLNVLGDANLSLTSSDTNIFTVNSAGSLYAAAVGNATLTGVYAYVSGSGTNFYTNSTPVSVYRDHPAMLMHRYSFTNDASDSVGGAVWNGTLPKGGSFSGGQVTLTAASQQYVQLPAGILSNFTAVTIDAWVSFGTLPGACFFYGFGNTSGGSGIDYIFCQPKDGRIAITDTNYSGEQGATGGGNWSGQSNLHITSVYNPPAGYVALYTNGVLVAQNNAETVPFTSVNAVINYIGRSLYSGDSYMNFSLDEFRIYNGVLHSDEIAATQVLGPNQILSVASPLLGVSISGGNLTLFWALASAGFTLESATSLGAGDWTPVSPTPQINGNQWQLALPLSGSVRYFRLKK